MHAREYYLAKLAMGVVVFYEDTPPNCNVQSVAPVRIDGRYITVGRNAFVPCSYSAMKPRSPKARPQNTILYPFIHRHIKTRPR